MDKINIYWGADNYFEEATKELDDVNYLIDVINHIDKTSFRIEGLTKEDDLPFEIENLLINTDDYGGVKEWALLGFSNNILENPKVNIHNLWLCNPPIKIYKDVIRSYDDSIILEHSSVYNSFTIDTMRKMFEDYDNVVIGQPNIIKQVLAPIYALQNNKRKKPVTLLFLGDSGIGKTETAKYIGSCLNEEIVRIQFSMQQTDNAYRYIFGANHSDDSLARELIRRKSNVILFDEFDKVSPLFYNAFYQMFDEGIFVDANYSIDVSKCVIICTTNYSTEKEAEKYLGSPIYSRFSKVIAFNPIGVDDKIKIAKKYFEKIISTISCEDVKLIENNTVLDFFINAISKGYYPNMRMLKNDIEDAVYYEILKAKGIIKQKY